MTAVPRLLEKVYDKIYAKGNDLKGLKKILFYWSVKIGLKYDPNQKNNIVYNIKHWIAYKLVLSKWKMALGGIWKLYVLEALLFSLDWLGFLVLRE